MKKLLSYVLVLALIISAVPMCFAEETTAIDPFVIFKEVKEPTNEELKAFIEEFNYRPLYENDFWNGFSFMLFADNELKTPEDRMSDDELIALFFEKINIKPEALYPNGHVLIYERQNRTTSSQGNRMWIRPSFDGEMQNAIFALNSIDTIRFFYNYCESFKVEDKSVYINHDYKDIKPQMKYAEKRTDVNFDGDFNVLDLKYLKSFLLGKKELINLFAADKDGDGEVGMKDYKIAKRALIAG